MSAQHTPGPRPSAELGIHNRIAQRPWIALVDGRPLLDGRGGQRRFKTEAAALDAAQRKCAAIAKAGGAS